MKYLRNILFIAILFVSVPGTVKAVTGADFDPGRIMDDGVFYDDSTMTVQEIDDFLWDMLDDSDQVIDGVDGVCDTNGVQSYGGTTRAIYAAGAAKGNATPFICLPEYYENPSTGVNNYYEYNNSTNKFDNIYNGTNPSGSKSAARLIYDVAKLHGINPQVLIVLLQKEQGLVTDDWAWGLQYYKAVGYACPDTGPCDPTFAGFYNQLERAANQFNRYKNFPNDYGHIAGVNNNVRFHPNASCGTSSVFIENQATAGRYHYTPYQPNSAALSNLYGTGNSCSAYGNRNFWRLFSDWFGDTTVEYRAYTYYRYKHQSIVQGESGTAETWFKNNGNKVWYDQTGVATAPAGNKKVMLYTSSPLGASNPLGSSWGSSKNVPARDFTAVYEADGTTLAADQHMVEPGQIAAYTITFEVPANLKPGVYRNYFQPSLFQEPNEFNQPSAFLDVTVVKAKYTASTYYRYKHQSIVQGESGTAETWFKNNGNKVWYDQTGVATAPAGNKKVMLYTSSPLGASNPLGSSWGSSKNVPARDFTAVYEADGTTLAADQHMVEPGQIAAYTITFEVPANLKPDVYRNYFQPSLFQESSAFNTPIAFLDVTVVKASYSSSSFYRFKNQSISPGASSTVQLWYTNTGSKSWYDQTGVATAPAGNKKVMLYTSSPLGASNPFGISWGGSQDVPGRDFTAVYESDGTTLAADQHKVNPGQIAAYSFDFTVPAGYPSGSYRNYFQPSLFQEPYAFNIPHTFLDVQVP